MIDKATVDRILSATDIVDVIGDFVTLKRKGVNYQACCPFHNEKTPSFVVSPAKGYYKCFGCGKGGSAVGFVMDHENIGYPEALKYLAKKYGIEVQERELSDEQKRENDDRESMMAVNIFASGYFSKVLKESREGQNIGLSYLRERGFTDSTIEKFSLGYCPAAGDELSIAAIRAGHKEEFLVGTGLTIKRESGGYYDRFAGRVIFPVHSVSGRVLAFGGRTLRSDKKVAKYLNSPESKVYHKSATLYGIDLARKSIVMNNRCILVEGYTDVIQMSQAGIENVVASSGTSLTVEQIQLVSRFTKNITVIYDGDSAGLKASMRGIDLILAQGLNVRVVALPDGEDPDSFAKSHSTSELEEYILSHEQNFITFKTHLLLGEAGRDPLARATVIKDIVESIAVIPDKITRQEFAKECSRVLDSDEQTIMREVERKNAFNSGGKEALSQYNNSVKREQYEQRQRALESAPVFEKQRDGSLTELERELAAYLIKYGDMSFFFMSEQAEPIKMNIGKTIIDELDVDNIEMRDEMSREITLCYREAISQGGDISQNIFLNHHNDAISQFTVNLLSMDDRYRPSQIWQRNDEVVILERDNLDVAVPKTIALYKLKIIDSIKDDLVQRLSGEADMAKQLELLSQVGALDRSRKMICERFSRIL